jgi:hypothetical protein
VFTEFGVRNTVGQYDGRGVPDCARAWQELAIVDDIFARRPEVWGYQIFAAGHVEGWLDFSPCLE